MKIYSFILSLLLIFFSVNVCQAKENSNSRIGFSTGIGILVAGDRKITGGFSLSPSVLAGYKVNNYFGVSYQNLPNVNTFKKIENAGLLDQNSLMFSFLPKENILLDLGPSVDFLSMIMCNNKNKCARQTGFAGGGSLRFALTENVMSVGMGVVVNLHFAMSPSRLYNGPLFTSNVGPVWEF